MKRGQRIPKLRDRLLADCESQLKFLSEALDRYQTEPDRYKQIAGVLRQLVCASGKNKPLLLDLLDDLGLAFDVHPISDLPFPIMMVTDLHKVPPPDVHERPVKDIRAELERAKHPVPLRKFINEGLAVFIRGKTFSHRDLILAVSQQLGGAHEDREVEISLVEMEQFVIAGYSSYGLNLLNLGRAVVDAGVRLITFAAKEHGYRPHSLNLTTGRPTPQQL